MEHFFSYKKNPWLGYAMVGLVFLLFLFAEILNKRFWLSDFEVYYKSAARILEGQNLYRIKADDFYIFKYSPVSAVFFIPFAILPFWIAKVVYWLFYSFIMLACIHLAIRMVWPDHTDKRYGSINSLVLLTGLILMVHFLRELHLGQVNYILMFLYLLSCRYLVAGKPGAVGILVSISLFIKPFALIFLPYFLYKKKWKELAYVFLYTIILAAVPLLFYRSFTMTASQSLAWLHELFVELGNKQEFSLPANQTIFSVIARYAFLGGILTTPLRFEVFQLLILLLLAFLMVVLIRRGNGISKQEITEMIFLTGLIPLLAFSGENSFGLFLLAVVLILYSFKDLSLPMKILAIIGFVFVGGNIHDLWGDELSAWIDKVSLISLGAMSLWFIVATLRFRKLC
ncbi:MAG: glycosyltransferase family 87 protein [Bacteroidetes bacterium]|nr:glycosyltransferase family 87 protein [Bacteroidota bacterium]